MKKKNYFDLSKYCIENDFIDFTTKDDDYKFIGNKYPTQINGNWKSLIKSCLKQKVNLKNFYFMANLKILDIIINLSIILFFNQNICKRKYA